MPLFAHLTVDIRCPQCGSLVRDLVEFQWAYCRGYALRTETSYVIGDEVRWRTCADGSIPAWSFFAEGAGNVGDPGFKDLVVREYWLADTPHDCGLVLGGIAVEVRDGVITKAWAYQSGDFDNSSYFYVLNRDGSTTPMPDWDDHAMDWVDVAKCGDGDHLTIPVPTDRLQALPPEPR
jgi:hypothetical protein